MQRGNGALKRIFHSSLHALSWRALVIGWLLRDITMYNMDIFPLTCPWPDISSPPRNDWDCVVFPVAIAILYTASALTCLSLGLTCTLSFDACATDDACRPPCPRNPIRHRQQRTGLATTGNCGKVQPRARQNRPEYGRRHIRYNRHNLSLCSICALVERR